MACMKLFTSVHTDRDPLTREFLWSQYRSLSWTWSVWMSLQLWRQRTHLKTNLLHNQDKTFLVYCTLVHPASVDDAVWAGTGLRWVRHVRYETERETSWWTWKWRSTDLHHRTGRGEYQTTKLISYTWVFSERHVKVFVTGEMRCHWNDINPDWQ